MKTLCLYTAQYPYGVGEQFIETEIKYLAAAYTEVLIFAANGAGIQRALPDNVKVIQLENTKNYSTSKGVASLGRWFFSCLSDTLKQNNQKMAWSNLLRFAYSAKVLHRYLTTNHLTHAVHYTYWFDDWSTCLSILVSNGIIKGYVSRAHGFDLYHDRRINGYIPYRLFQLNHVSKLVLISQDGKNYMEMHYPQYKDKYELSYLGVENWLPFKAEVNTNPQYLVVSCSRMVDIKRVDLIVKSLALIHEIPIKWVHFGGGELFEETKKMAIELLPQNVEWEFTGHVDNQDIYRFYQEHHPDCFINVSSSEGLPVTLMEAISYGIPVIATNVGGTAEIANKETGILLVKDPIIDEIANSLKSFLKQKARNINFRESVYLYWQRTFNANTNYQLFSNQLNEINH
ncbi:glycosyltransferase involved in cell wall biosynthesis [Breznakibacter xylanolyticus]|uniref:Glycosyltransferase involved in cell wall biosynthesis n=1 Tax=Breznakibacter xylanolyticus TaxID=990 RepID=A0A2W7NKW1_9BACT|nr:glycosyltransferase [Breznakibacter xylanolyticus]PZX11932.1 glycosyltransferase involved in cell wall biosynthesis [Breznakibacter xylanolyticus]